jgi:hypothetical protein
MAPRKLGERRATCEAVAEDSDSKQVNNRGQRLHPCELQHIPNKLVLANAEPGGRGTGFVNDKRSPGFGKTTVGD